MATRKGVKDNLLGAAQTVFKVLEPLDADARQRVLTSALSLLGMAKVDPSPNPSHPPDASRPPAQSPSARPMSPVELIQQKNPATNAQRIALFAYHRDKNEGQSRFGRADLLPYFAKARLPAPANYDRDFSSAVQLGYIYEDGTESYLTSRGVEAVEAGFGGRAAPRGISKVKAEKKKKRPAKRR
jgi:hypothetical protein